MKQRPPWILPVIIISQFAGTSIWFAGNAIIGDLQMEWELPVSSLGYVTSSVQLGFISGTLFFAFFLISDRFSPRLVFFISSVLGAAANIGVIFFSDGLSSLLVFRFVTGFFLAGIYPVGMKIAAGWYKHGLGAVLGYLVGALVLGTAFPHLLKSLEYSFEWESVVLSVSVISITGGLLMLMFVPNGPFLSKGTKFNPRAIYIIFKSKALRQAALGYFGHMWELYTLWAFVPVLLAYYTRGFDNAINIQLWSFLIIGAGGLGCAVGGGVSKKTGSKSVAFYMLLFSGICCLLSPLIYNIPPWGFLLYLLFWGVVVAGDSPQFSALVALSAPKDYVGSALTIVTSIGFLITIFSIEFIDTLSSTIKVKYLMLFLVPGPLFGLISLLYGNNKVGSA